MTECQFKKVLVEEIELPKTTKAEELTLEEVEKIIEAKAPKKKVPKKKTAKKK